MKSALTKNQKLAWVYFIGFAFVVLVGYVPGFTNAEGLLFGLFEIDPIDDLLHMLSGVLAIYAALKSSKYTTWYFLVVGVVYGIETITTFIWWLGSVPLMDNILIQMPHVLIVSVALYAGLNWQAPAERISKK